MFRLTKLFSSLTAIFLVAASTVHGTSNTDVFNQEASILGTLSQPHLPKFLTNNPLPGGYPWGNQVSQRSGPPSPPRTGVTRYYNFTVGRANLSPDGFLKPSIVINGQNPGPLIEANYGDEIQVTVNNNISGPQDGTSIHWHGFLQKDTPWMDGVPSLTQCPIAPGSSFTYRFTADSFGTSWYHSHYSAQLLDGVAGPIVVYGPSQLAFDEDLGPIFLTDYYHTGYKQLMEDIFSTNATTQIQPTDNNLINGKMPFNCSLAPAGSTCTPGADYAKFRVQTGKTYKLRLINGGGGAILDFSIDNHNLTVIANDFTPLVPYNTTIVTTAAGQRTDVLFTPRGNGSIWMRSNVFGKFCSRASSPAARAIIFLDDTTDGTIPTSKQWPLPIDSGFSACATDPLNKTVPYYAQTPPKPSITFNITMNSIINATGHSVYTMNGNPFQGDYNDPVLLLASEKNYTYPSDPKWNVVNFGNNTSIRINVWNNNSSPHPMHLHGHNFWVLHEGPGQWDGVSITNPTNPQYRDTQAMIAQSHMVIQYNANNPGTWAFHCHIAFHLSEGLFMTFLERPADITQRQIPQIIGETCTNWQKYTNANVVDVIDSGV